jgi:hypothetical protein
VQGKIQEAPLAGASWSKTFLINQNTPVAFSFQSALQNPVFQNRNKSIQLVLYASACVILSLLQISQMSPLQQLREADVHVKSW